MPIPNLVVLDQFAQGVDFFEVRLGVGRLVEPDKVVNRRRVVLVVPNLGEA